MRTGGPTPGAFVDIKHIPDMMRLEIDEEGLHNGAAVPALRCLSSRRVSAF